MKALLHASIFLAAALLSSSPALTSDEQRNANAAADFHAAFARLKALQGVWDEAPWDDAAPGRVVRYRLTGKGSALIEEYIGDPSMTTVYHLDGNSLRLTHYCNAGNQPRMKASSYEGDSLKFDFVDVTNLSAPEAYYTRMLEITFRDDDHVDLNFVGRKEGLEVPGLVSLTRRTAIEDGR